MNKFPAFLQICTLSLDEYERAENITLLSLCSSFGLVWNILMCSPFICRRCIFT